MRLPYQVDDFRKRNFFRRKIDLNSFGVISKTVISRIRLLAAGVTYPRPINSFDDPKLGVGSPESSERERCGL